MVILFAVISGYLKTREPVHRTEQQLLHILFAEAEWSSLAIDSTAGESNPVLTLGVIDSS